MSETYQHILAFLESQNLPYIIHEHTPSRTVEDARERLNFPLERLLKTVAFKIKDNGYVLAAVRAPDQVDYKKLAEAAGTKRTLLFRLSPEEVVEVLGVEAGCVGPLTMRSDQQIFFDSGISADEMVYCGIGRADRTLEMRFEDLMRLSGGKPAVLAKSA